MRLALACVLLVASGWLVACAPTVDGPVEKQRATDTLDAQRLTSQLTALPGVERAEVMLRRDARDPLSTAAPAPSTISVVLVVDDKTDRARVDASARTLAKALVDVEPTIVVDIGAKRAELARVGPFTVEAASKGPLKAALAIALVVIAALAGFIVWSYRRTNNAQ